MEYDFTEAVEKIQRICEERNWDSLHGPKDLAVGLTAEAAELLKIFRFKTEKQSLALLKSSVGRRQVEQELAEALFFLLRFSQMYAVDLNKALAEKIEQTRYKYPVEIAG